MRRLWAIASLVALLGVLGLVAGCVSSSEEEARTPEGAATVANSAFQTDADGNTIPAEPDGGAPPAETETAGGEEPGQEVDGDAAAGEAFFAQSCQGCHMDGGRAAGVGPQLAGAGLDAATVEDVVSNGRGAMPPGLASGDDLTNVVAYVVGLQ